MSSQRNVTHAKPELELKVATRDLVRAVGGTDGAGETCGARQQRMSDCGNRHTADFLRLDEVAKLEDVAPAPLVTLTLARRQGFELVPARSRAVPERLWGQYVARLMKEAGDVMSGLGKALESGDDVDQAEAGGLLAEVDELVALAVEMREALRRRAEGSI